MFFNQYKYIQILIGTLFYKELYVYIIIILIKVKKPLLIYTIFLPKTCKNEVYYAKSDYKYILIISLRTNFENVVLYVKHYRTFIEIV